MTDYSLIEDLTHLVGPLTEETVVRCLQAKFYSQRFQCKLGPVIVSLNNNRYRPSARCLLESTRPDSFLDHLVREAVTQHADTGHSQAIICSGESGSGKTFSAMHMLRQLFDLAGGGSETDAFKHLSATLTVLRSLCSAAAVTNSESSRVGFFIENFITDSAIYRTKIHSYLLDRDRVCSVQQNERNYHIFYQMLAGLGPEEKAKLHLTGYSMHNLSYLSLGNTYVWNEMEEKSRFDAWKSSLAVLGIPFSDVMRIFSAILLLGNIEFIEGSGLELDIIGNNEIKAVAALLGVSGVALYRGFTTRTRNTRGQLCKSLADANTANATRNALAKSLYSRTVAAILKRANNLRRPTINSSLSGSTESNLHHVDPGGMSFSEQMFSRSSSIRSGYEKAKYDGFISIIDMFGFETAQKNQLEQLCMNLCAETIQHFYNTHIFKSTMQALRDENIQTEVEVRYLDNEPILELLTSQRNGILSILDIECAQPRSSTEVFTAKVKAHHRVNNYFFEPLPKTDTIFGIRHFAGRVVYDTNNFLQNNRDILADDVVAVFSKQNCNFGFVSHLFTQENKQHAGDLSSGPQGLKHRILPNSSDFKLNGARGTLSSDFQTKLDNLLKTMMHAKPHFVLCLKTNDRSEMDMVDGDVIIRQLRSLQVLETVNLMAGGIPHRMRYKSFNNRYKIFFGQKKPYQLETQQDQCKAILNSFLKAMDESRLPYVSTQWMFGKKHVFFSEGTRQQLEAMRRERINKAAAIIQAYWKGQQCRRNWSQHKKQLASDRDSIKSSQTCFSWKSNKSKKVGIIRKDENLLQQASKYYNISLESVPSVPPNRSYCVAKNIRLGYPHHRIMKDDFPKEAMDGTVLCRGEEVDVVGPSSKRGHLIVKNRDLVMDVPYHLLDLKTIPELPAMDI
ncbi:unconventional myosin-VIIa-like isoform X2 [Ostrea edulis]|nr:unconventional myosin-VIIa-like isoform X2 [Ostrea edulis]XP_056017699.1 unconventional myosin-VIIa-like isoform X2 [Ostrea edulis]